MKTRGYEPSFMDNAKSRKLLISSGIALLFAVAVIWLLFRACSAGGEKDQKIFHIARDSTWYPLDLRGKEKNMVGFANDLAQEIGAIENFRVHVFEEGPSGLLDGVETGNYDAIFTTLTPNTMNERRFAFSKPFYLVGPVLVVQEKSDATSLKDLEGKIIGIESGAMQIYNIQEPKNVVIIPYDSASEVMENLTKNIINGAIMDALKAHVYCDGYYKGKLKVVTAPFTDKGLRLLAKKNPAGMDLVSRFNAGLETVKETGAYDKLIKNWDLINTELPDAPAVTKE